MGNSSSSSELGKTSVYKVTEENKFNTEEKQEVVNIRHGYYKNKKSVYYDGISLNLSKKDISSFKKLKYGYAKTNIHVYYKGNIITDANPNTFITINRKNMPEEFKKLNSVIGMDFKNETKRIYQFGILLYTI
jgi:hypothetical protein